MKQFSLGTIVGAAIIFLFMRTCNEPATIDHHAIDSLNTIVHIRDSSYSADSLKMTATMHQKDSIIAALSEGKAAQYDALKGQIVQLTFQRNKYRTAAEAKDTVGQLQSCAEFMHLADSFYTKAVVYETTIDSLIAATTSQHNADTASITSLMRERQQVREERDAYKNFMDQAIKENTDLRKTLARSKRGKWLMLIAGVIGGGIIEHSIK
jgi:hypothetical protein